MPSLSDTAYPRLSSQPSPQKLASLYTPTDEEKAFAQQMTRTPFHYLGLLILLKTFHRLGYAVPLAQVSDVIRGHIASTVDVDITAADWVSYDTSQTRKRHLSLVRDYCQIKPYRQQGKVVMEEALAAAAQTKQDLVDLINIAVQTLSEKRIELPGFTTLERAARTARHKVTLHCYETIDRALSPSDRTRLQRLFVQIDQEPVTGWEKLKQEPGKPILSKLKLWIERFRWIQSLPQPQSTLDTIPRVKVLHFAAEAQSLDIARMKELSSDKRYSLAVALISAQSARALDDLAELFIKRMRQLHHDGKAALAQYRSENQQRTDELISTLKSLVIAYQTEGKVPERFTAIEQVMGDNAPDLLEQCEAHLAYLGDNYFPFLPKLYRSHRPVFFSLLNVLPLHSSTQDTSLIEAIAFIQTHRGQRKTWISLSPEISTQPDASKPNVSEETKAVLDLSWIPKNWWGLVTGLKTRSAKPTQVHRTYFELCVFSHLLLELQSGDVYLQGSDEYGDYYGQLISWDDYHASIQDYGKLVNLPVESKAFVQQVQQLLAAAATTADQSFPSNTQVSYQKERLVIHKPKTISPPDLAQLEALIQQRMQPVHVLDILADTDAWLTWTRAFGPLSGYDAKLDNPVARYVMTAFCYGCNLGPSQTARSLHQVDRRQLAHVHHRHISEDKLQQAIVTVINDYHRFKLPQYWGSGKHASVDGTKWDVYENNLMAEYHIRYRGYGAIGYYHVADSYIALFSNFIPCGVWEAIYMLDGLLFNESDIQPDTIHGDTQAQSATVFALAYLLGITLMPRIRRWQNLDFYRPSRGDRYEHLDDLFTQTVDWTLIERHLPDMFRVALSIKEGKLKPSTILRKLGTNSRKNKLFQAFYELGSALRTRFLLQYLTRAELRSTIQAAINKSESFNRFAKWLSFGGEIAGIASNNRDEMRKRLKYNHLVANCVIFYNVVELTRVLNQLHQEGYRFEQAAIAALSPYLAHHINRFGLFQLDSERQPLPLDFELAFGEPVFDLN